MGGIEILYTNTTKGTNMDIKITKTENSKLKDIDFNNIPFGKYTSDHIFIMDYANDQWGDFRIVPYQSLKLDPQSKALQYCQCIFEGMKATIGADGIPKLLRPDLNIERFNLSAERYVYACGAGRTVFISLKSNNPCRNKLDS